MPSGPTIRRGQSSGEHGTPWPFIRACESKFGGPIASDLAATLLNSKAAYAGLHYSEGSLQKDWYHLAGLLWLNPPFADIAPWVRKCAEENALGAEILLLVPMGGQNWYWDYVEPCADVYSIGRLQFEGSKWPYPKDLILAHYRYPVPRNYLRVQRWQWQNEVTGTSTTPQSASSAVAKIATRNAATRLDLKT